MPKRNVAPQMLDITPANAQTVAGYASLQSGSQPLLTTANDQLKQVLSIGRSLAYTVGQQAAISRQKTKEQKDDLDSDKRNMVSAVRMQSIGTRAEWGAMFAGDGQLDIQMPGADEGVTFESYFLDQIDNRGLSVVAVEQAQQVANNMIPTDRPVDTSDPEGERIPIDPEVVSAMQQAAYQEILPSYVSAMRGWYERRQESMREAAIADEPSNIIFRQENRPESWGEANAAMDQDRYLRDLTLAERINVYTDAIVEVAASGRVAHAVQMAQDAPLTAVQQADVQRKIGDASATALRSLLTRDIANGEISHDTSEILWYLGDDKDAVDSVVAVFKGLVQSGISERAYDGLVSQVTSATRQSPESQLAWQERKSDTSALGSSMTEQELALIQHHRDSLDSGEYTTHEDGSVSSIGVITVRGPEGGVYNVPSHWGGRSHSPEAALSRAMANGLETYPRYDRTRDANRAAKKVNSVIDEDMNHWTPGSMVAPFFSPLAIALNEIEPPDADEDFNVAAGKRHESNKHLVSIALNVLEGKVAQFRTADGQLIEVTDEAGVISFIEEYYPSQVGSWKVEWNRVKDARSKVLPGSAAPIDLNAMRNTGMTATTNAAIDQTIENVRRGIYSQEIDTTDGNRVIAELEERKTGPSLFGGGNQRHRTQVRSFASVLTTLSQVAATELRAAVPSPGSGILDFNFGPQETPRPREGYAHELAQVIEREQLNYNALHRRTVTEDDARQVLYDAAIKAGYSEETAQRQAARWPGFPKDTNGNPTVPSFLDLYQAGDDTAQDSYRYFMEKYTEYTRERLLGDEAHGGPRGWVYEYVDEYKIEPPKNQTEQPSEQPAGAEGEPVTGPAV